MNYVSNIFFNKRKSVEKKVLVFNFLYLSVLQSLNYLFPLITLPYLIRVLGIEKIGLIAFVQAIMQYFMIVTDYGFDLTATKDITLNKGNQHSLSKIFSSVMTIKIILMVICFVILGILVLSIDRLKINTVLYLVSFLMVSGQVLFPIWFFQGIEQMKYITFINVIVKGISVILVFIMIRNEIDFFKYVILYSITPLIIGCVGLIIVLTKFKIQFELPSLSDLKNKLQEGKHIFLSNICISMYMSSNVIILGAFTNNTIVGYYSLVEKVIFAIRGFAGIIFRSIYPYVCRTAMEGLQSLIRFFKKLFIPIGSIFFLAGTFLAIFPALIIRLLSGHIIPESEIILRVLSYVPLIVVMNIPAYQILIVYKFERDYFRILLAGAILNVLLNMILSYYLNGYGTAISVFIAEIFVTAGLYITVKNKSVQMSATL